MLQQRKVVSIGKYHKVNRVISSSQPTVWETLKDFVLGILAVITFIIGFILALGQ